MTSEQQTCQERLDHAMSWHIKTMCKALRDHRKGRDETLSTLRANVLSIDVTTVHRVLLSWGGPAAFFEVSAQNGKVYRIDYSLHDGARYTLSEQDAQLVLDVYGPFDGIGE